MSSHTPGQWNRSASSTKGSGSVSGNTTSVCAINAVSDAWSADGYGQTTFSAGSMETSRKPAASNHSLQNAARRSSWWDGAGMTLISRISCLSSSWHSRI